MNDDGVIELEEIMCPIGRDTTKKKSSSSNASGLSGENTKDASELQTIEFEF